MILFFEESSKIRLKPYFDHLNRYFKFKQSLFMGVSKRNLLIKVITLSGFRKSSCLTNHPFKRKGAKHPGLQKTYKGSRGQWN